MNANLKEIRKRRVYSEEFKKEIVNFYESGRHSVLKMERLYEVMKLQRVQINYLTRKI